MATTNTTKPTPFDEQAIRANFPALSASTQIYMDNAGGSQILSSVITSISTYLSTNNVQLGASYPISQKSTSYFNEGHISGASYINASPSEIVMGASTTQLFRNLSIALKIDKGDEIVLSMLDHEANLAPWVQLAEWKGCVVKWWIPSKDTDSNPKLEVDDLMTLMSERTRLVCCTHTSNILGSITDVKAIAGAVHGFNTSTDTNKKRALICVDAVAYAPHGPIDVKDLGVDFYSFSIYKVYGPHLSMLYASEEAQRELVSLGHFFKKGETLEEKLGLAGASYELVQAMPLVKDYVERVGWDAISKQEEDIQEILLAYLRGRSDVIKIYGEKSSDRNLRVPVISFRVKGRSSLGIIDAIEARSNFGCRSGHFYSKRLCENVLGIEDGDDGVVRCSLLHYNTKDEVRGLVKVLDEVIAEGVTEKENGVDGRKEVANW